MTTLREAAAMALMAMPHKQLIDELLDSRIAAAQEIERLRAELFEALCKRHVEAEPVAWIFTWDEIAKDRHVRRIIDCEERPNIPGYDLIPLYTSPPQRKPLTEEQIKPIFDQWKILYGGYTIDFIRAIERAHGIGSQE